ncbi:MAG: PadR family transcriptional regulator [Coriobacteriales bacterium]|jgi:DNA-binding PadR family transcriptional regulator|nr:PadR family transcriptional regulator [Coriobacteriales bacterium]
MNRNKHLPLTETMYYILLALQRPAHGYLVMQQVRELSAGEVNIAAGTMYGALENLKKQGLIQLVGLAEGRRKTYQITPYGAQVLSKDRARLRHMVSVAEAVTATVTETAAEI